MFTLDEPIWCMIVDVYLKAFIMTRKKPWNRVNNPVYSCSTKAGESSNMHIMTYATAVSMKPKRFICGIFHGTKTLENIESNSLFVLQLLSDKQYRLVDLLGKKSGKNVDKIGRLYKRNELMVWDDFFVLKNCLAVMKMKVINSFDAGDHKCFLCEVVAYKNINEGNALMLDTLRKHKIIRA